MKKVLKWEKLETQEIRNRVEYYKAKMFLDEWMIDLKFDNWYCLEDWVEDRSVTANTEVLYEYKKASIMFFIPSKVEFKKDQWYSIDQIIKHELAHNATDRLTKLAEERFVSQREIDKECESLTQYISNCINSDYKDGRKILPIVLKDTNKKKNWMKKGL